MNDMLDLALEPDESAPDMQRMPPLRNSSLRTSGRLKIVSIKKYLLQRLGLSDAPASVRYDFTSFFVDTMNTIVEWNVVF